MAKQKSAACPADSLAVTRPPWGTLFCFNPLFVFVFSLHTVHFSVEPREAYQLIKLKQEKA